MGIQPSYYDIRGNLHRASVESINAVIRAMGAPPCRHPMMRLVQPVSVVSVNNQPGFIRINLPLAEGGEAGVAINMEVTDEQGRVETSRINGMRAGYGETIDGIRYVTTNLPDKTDRPMGYYEVSVECLLPNGVAHCGRMRLIVAPDSCYLPDNLRTWGVSANLYAMRSKSNWGTGDIGDLRELLRWAGEMGGGFVGINPLHAAHNRLPYDISPYCAVSRLYNNHIYIDMSGIAPKKTATTSAAINSLKSSRHIDYEGASRLKLDALRSSYRKFKARDIKNNSPEAAAFKDYVDQEGEHLDAYAAFMALYELHNAGPDFWGPEYKTYSAHGVSAFRKKHKDKIMFYKYVQWIIHGQLSDAKKLCKGMAIGIYGDLAVGSSSRGSDAWTHPWVFAHNIGVGAPPDDFSPLGQNWAFPPMIPTMMRDTGYELFIQTIRKNLRYAGAVRIDHALGLFRLFWIPDGFAPGDGVYVNYPHEDLIRIIALESMRSRTVIIAEDLGTVPQEFKEILQRFGMLSYRLFYFERDWSSGSFIAPNAYPETAIAAVNTHDLPTLWGYWSGHDIDVKESIGIYHSTEAHEQDTQDRRRVKQAMLDALRREFGDRIPQSIDSAPEMTRELFVAVHKFLARSNSRLVSVSLDDLMGELDQQNLPGTVDTHHNWLRKSKLTLEELFENPTAIELSRDMKEAGRGGGGQSA